jgi:hypothetical protein
VGVPSGCSHSCPTVGSTAFAMPGAPAWKQQRRRLDSVCPCLDKSSSFFLSIIIIIIIITIIIQRTAVSEKRKEFHLNQKI